VPPKPRQKIEAIVVTAKNDPNAVMSNAIENHDELGIGNQFGIRGFYSRPYRSRHIGPNIKKFPRILWPVLLVIKNLRAFLLPRRINWNYSGDEIATGSILAFMDEDLFRASYRRMRVASREVNDPGLHFRVHQILWATHNCFKLDGDFVECGTGRGMMMSAALHSLENWNAANKNLYLCDTFEPFGIDPETGRNDERFGVRDTYAKSLSDVEANFSEWKRINFVVGLVPDSLQSVVLEKVSFLHIDLNNAAAEVGALRHFWPKIVKGGIIVLDDFAQVLVQNQAMIALGNELGFSILTTGTGQGIIVK
jgi:hypothetical protein